jgi:hypothetical protein
MPGARRDREPAAGRPSPARRYRLILLHEERRVVELESERELGLGDRFDLQGLTVQIIGLAWRRGEALLCTPVAPKMRDQAIRKEQAWWSTQWHT